jgi:hypothetical protein
MLGLHNVGELKSIFVITIDAGTIAGGPDEV